MTAIALPIGSDCFAPLKAGWSTGYRGTLIQYVQDPVMGPRAILAIGEATKYGQRTVRVPAEHLTLWEAK